MKMLRWALGASLSLGLAAAALAQTQPIPGAVTASGSAATVNGSAIIIAPAANASGRGNPVAVDRGLPVVCLSGCGGGGGGGGDVNIVSVGGTPIVGSAVPVTGSFSATTAGTATAAAPSYVEGSSNPLSLNLTGDLRTIAKQSGTWDIGTLGTVTNPVGIKGANGSGIVSNANPLPISDGGGSLTVDGTVGVSGSVAVTGTFWQATQPVSLASQPLPTGAATSALQSGVQATLGAVTVNRAAIYDNTGNPVDWTAPVPINIAATTTGGCTPYGYQSAASNNATSVATGARTLCGLTAINTTGTLQYLRLYNVSGAPTCSSATGFLYTVPVPASTTGAGAALPLGPFGQAFSAGLSFCITGGPTSTDNTNATTGIFVVASYK